MSYQKDRGNPWEQVTLVTGKNPVKALNAPREEGPEKTTYKKPEGGQNLANRSTIAPHQFRNLAEMGEVTPPKYVSKEFGRAMAQLRTAKGLSRDQVAARINQKSTVIADYEEGKAIPQSHIVQQLQRILGPGLPSTK